MHTKQKAEILAQQDPMMKHVNDPAVALGMVISALRFRKDRDQATGYCVPRALRTLYRAAKLEMPEALRLSLKKKELTYEIGRAELLHLAVSAAKNIDEGIADSIIAMASDLPVRRLTTVLNDKSDALVEIKQRAEDKIAYEKKTVGELKALGALDAGSRIPTMRQAMNEAVLVEIVRFAGYNRLLREIDFNRSKVTKSNVVHLCCTQKFADALSNACVPGVGKFLPTTPRAAAWPYPV